MYMESFTHDAYRETYIQDEDFEGVIQQLQIQIHANNGDGTIDYDIQNGLLYRLDNLCVPKREKLQLIR